jgi:5-methylcytosine-specific restriction endonuclease McrA
MVDSGRTRLLRRARKNPLARQSAGPAVAHQGRRGLTAELRQLVTDRALSACEYCRLHENDAAFRHEVDHFISQKHGGSEHHSNLALACFLGNRYKGSDIAALDSAGELVQLFHPRTQRWPEHFRLRTGRIFPAPPQDA